MKVSRLNGSNRVSRIHVERHLPELERIYRSLIREAARDAANALIATSEVKPMTAAANVPDWQIPPEGVLFAIATTAGRATKRLRKLHRQIVRETAGPTLARAGISWTVTHPVSQNLLDQTGQRTGELLGQTIQPVLGEVVAGAYREGLSVRDTADLIQAKFVEASPAQAAMLARTDLNSLSNGGSVMAATMVGASFKQWLTAEDDRVRETHAEADGQIVPIDDPFDVGGEQLDYPGDPNGSDAETCNCRCTVIYVDDLGAETGSSAPRARLPSRGFMAKPADPRQRIPARGFAAVTVTVDQPETMGPALWVSDLAFEDAATEDGRYILPDALTWRELPLSLGAMFDTPHADVVTAAPVCGRIESMEKRSISMNGDQLAGGMRAVYAAGEFDMGGETGADVARLVADETMRGVSIDLAIDDWCFRDPESGDLVEPDEMSPSQMEKSMMGEMQFAVRAGTIMAATVCPTPAFADARIAMAASGDGRRIIQIWAPFTLLSEMMTAWCDETMTASAAPLEPPEAWFYRAEADQPMPLTITDDGEVYGHVAAWNSCHTGRSGVCIAPPRSPSGNAYFNIGEIRCADGKRVACGQIFFHGEHAPLTLTAARVQDHYAHTGLVGADVRAVDGRHGIWVSGALRSSLTPEQTRELRAAKPSGDWRQMRPGGPLELTSILAVNDPGFPVPRGIVASADDGSGEPVALFATFAFPDVKLDRSLRVLAARAEGGIDALADLAGV